MRNVKITWTSGVVTETTVRDEDYIRYLTNLPIDQIANIDISAK
jgi:hypothetical protein